MRSASAALRRGSQHVSALDADTVLITRMLGSERVMMVVHRGNGVTIDPRQVAELREGEQWRDLQGRPLSALWSVAAEQVLVARHVTGAEE
jgi:hypothetical protein